MKGSLSYQDGYKAQQSRGLRELAVKANDRRVSAVEAWALACSLTHDDHLVRDWWPRMVGRPAEVVRRFSREIREAKPELRQTLITEFSKSHPAQPRKQEAL